MEDEKLDGFAPGGRPICVFCNAPWTDDMIKGYSDATEETGYYGESYIISIDTTIDITCSSCNRLVYRKEIRTYGG